MPLINQRRFEIQEACLALIATQQPAASDLREIVAILYMVVELERIGDYAAGIAKTVVLMKEEPLLKTFKKIPRMGEIARQMLSDAMIAFTNRDAEAARQIAERDTEIDDALSRCFSPFDQNHGKRTGNDHPLHLSHLVCPQPGKNR